MNIFPVNATLICFFALLIGVQTQAQTIITKHTDPAKLPDWRGLWIGANSATGRPVTGPSGPQPLRVPNPYSYTAEYAAKHEAFIKGQRGEGPYYDPTFNCVPPGVPRLLGNPYPQEFLVSAEKVVILYEIFAQVRQIYTDGRKHPDEDDLDYTFNGHSIGHWEGDTLVVDTVGLRGDTLLDATNVHSDALHVVERIRRTGATTMEEEIILTDAKAFTKPWTNIIKWRKGEPDWYLKEYVCAENNRTTSDESGHTKAILK